ncbi:hypothetical protein BN000_04735 [Neobacillus massiliamazoniensis]|uniref:Uncharacterized protein n=1 Tax=Neobacillus massiliamazoniensis TaxID=1499688 RepID=A0A0U1P336_9BACI|nr:hypothetical protein BN000_04735 [Neobacillus massiliamazoniensis]
MKYFILSLFIIGMGLNTLCFFNHNEVIFLLSQFIVGLGILFNTIFILKQKLPKSFLYLLIICFSFLLLFDAYRLGKLLFLY